MFPPKRNHSKSVLQHSIELKHLNRMRSYGTVPSEDLEADTSPSQQHIRSRKREQARKRSNVKGFGALVMIMCPMLFLWCGLSKDRDTSAVEPPSLSPPHLSGDTSLYLGLVEHDSDAHDQNFATLRTLFAIDMYATNTTDGCDSTGERSTWNLDRAGYAEFYLDDIVSDPTKYRRVLEADMIYCPRAGSDSSAHSRSVPCGVFGNSYSFQDASWQHSPGTRILDVTKHFNLAHRPSFMGIHRVRPCICKADGVPDGTVCSKALKPACRLVVECLGHVSARAIDCLDSAHVNGPNVETARTGPLAAVPVPGFYMLPGRALGPLSNIVPGGPAHNANTNVTDLLRSAPGPPRGRSASVKRGEPPTHDAAGSSIQSLQAMPPAAIVTTKTEIVAKASKKSMKSVYAALGMVVSLFLLTGTGHWMKRKRALAATHAAQSQRQSNEPYQFNNNSTPEPEDIRGTQTNHDLKSRVRAFFSVNLWKKALSLPSTWENDAVADLNDAERGDNGRKLQKKRGTILGDSVDLSVPIMPPAAKAIQSTRPASNAAATEGILRVETENSRPAIVGGLTTARHQGPRGAATRRSHRSSSMQTENA